MKKIFSVVLLSSLFISNYVHAGIKIKIKATVLSYNETRVKLKVESKIKYLYFNKLTQVEIDNLHKYLNKEKDFYVSKDDLKDKEIR